MAVSQGLPTQQRRKTMAIVLDHTIVPAKDKGASAEFFAEIFGLTIKPGQGYFAQVQVNESLTFDFADEPKPETHHYAFHISEAEFEAIFGRVKAKGLSYGSGPYNHTDCQIYTRRGGRGFYFEDPNGHLLEVMTVPETGS
jgi:catechol 2,3-dioxygenase-like lactoylglutathione lyase family enzyme